MKFVTLTSALGLFGLLLLGPGARAQTTAFNVVNPNNANDGDWHVVIVETGNAFSVTVSSTLPIPKSNANEVLVKFRDQGHNVMASANNGGGVIGHGAGAWNTTGSNGQTLEWIWTQALQPTLVLQNDGTNFFQGNATLFPTLGEKAEGVDITVFDSAHGPWTITDEQLTPEASSLALLLPGLIPMGIALRRRKTRD